jgi:hypothetical protein
MASACPAPLTGARAGGESRQRAGQAGGAVRGERVVAACVVYVCVGERAGQTALFRRHTERWEEQGGKIVTGWWAAAR